MARQEIKKLIEETVKRLYKEPAFIKTMADKRAKVKLEHSVKAVYGDYASNIAMVLKKNPQEIAKAIKSATELPQEARGKKRIKFPSLILDKVETKNGFINFFLSKRYLQKQIKEILKEGEKFGKLNIGKGKKTNIEFISANPTGQLHVGNGRGAFFGDCLANILEMAGYKVVREYYINDSKNSNQIQELGRTALGKGKSYLTPYLKALIKKLKPHLKKFKSETDAGYFLAQNILSDIRKFIKEKLKIKFDFWISEQNLYRQNIVKTTYNFLKSKKLVYEKDGAFWLKLSEFNQKDEVLVRRNGQSTYFLADITYHKYKIKRGFKKIVDIWGADHHGHVSKMKAAIKILGYQKDLDILISQMVRLKQGRMSKRKGKIITLKDLINEVGLDTARFLYLTKSLDTQMEFNLELAKEQSEKNPVYYVQYAHARICAILRKYGKSKFQNPNFKINSKFQLQHSKLSLLEHPSELALIKQLIKFPEIVEDTAKDYQVQRLPQYATDLATTFHQFYRDCKVLAKDRPPSEARLSLILTVQVVLKNTLSLMGISAPDKM